MDALDLYGALIGSAIFGCAFIGVVLGLWATESSWSH